MNKTFYQLLTALLCLVIHSTDVLSQGPDGFHYPGQPFGNLVSTPYGPTGENRVYGSSRGTLPYGPRPSIIYEFDPADGFINLFPTALSDTLEMIVQLYDENQILYGTAISYNGTTKLRSYVFSYDPFDRDFVVLKQGNVSEIGLYSVQAQIGNTLYGLRSAGGDNGYGVLFKINKDGTNYTELRHFEGLQDRPEQLIVRYEFDENGINLNQPIEFWTVAFAGGTYGKGALIVISLDGTSSFIRLDFNGFGSPDDTWGPTDGEGPIAVVPDIDTDFYVVTQSGGAHNRGAIFLVGQDGNYKVHDFTTAFPTPSGIPIVDKRSNKIFGIGGNVPGKKGFIYSFGLINHFNFNDHLVNFNTSTQIETPIALVTGETGYISGISQRGGGADHSKGTLFSVNTTTGAVTRDLIFEDGYTQLSGPANNATDVSINTLLQAKNQAGATQYVFLLSETEDFSGPLVTLTSDTRSAQPPRLKYSTNYYVRVKTDIAFYGPRTKFTTHGPEKYCFVGSPADGATNVAINNLKVTVNIVYGATLYTIELNTSPDFTGTSFVKTSAVANQRTMIFNGLSPATTYYTRAKTNYPSDWGPVRSFTTTVGPPPPAAAMNDESPIVRAYPNPFKDDFTAEVQNIADERATLVLLDVTGRQVYSGEIRNNEAIQLGGELPQGVYILQVKSRTSNTIQRLAKK